MPKVLIVEDHDEVARTVGVVIEGFNGWSVEREIDVAKAIERLRSGEFDCVLANMGKRNPMNGNAATILKAQTGVPVIVITGGLRKSLDALAPLKPAVILQKPFDKSTLFLALVAACPADKL